MTIRYCTPEWLEESARLYRASSRFEDELKRVTTNICFRITAEPAWGIEADVIFGAEVEAGKLIELDFFGEAEARNKAVFILSASPQDWKELLRKNKKFITEFLLGKVTLEMGSKTELLKITPYANHFIDALTQFELQYPDEMTPEELEAFRADQVALQAKLAG